MAGGAPVVGNHSPAGRRCSSGVGRTKRSTHVHVRGLGVAVRRGLAVPSAGPAFDQEPNRHHRPGHRESAPRPATLDSRRDSGSSSDSSIKTVTTGEVRDHVRPPPSVVGAVGSRNSIRAGARLSHLDPRYEDVFEERYPASGPAGPTPVPFPDGCGGIPYTGGAWENAAQPDGCGQATGLSNVRPRSRLTWRVTSKEITS